MAEPTAADCALAKSLWQRMSALTEKPDDWPEEWQPIAQAIADARVAGVTEGLEMAARWCDDYRIEDESANDAMRSAATEIRALK